MAITESGPASIEDSLERIADSLEAIETYLGTIVETLGELVHEVEPNKLVIRMIDIGRDR